MSHSEEQDATPRKGAYRAPTAAAVGKVEELTAGGGSQDYADGTGTYMDKKSRIEAYRAPTAATVGKVDELTAGAGPHYTDGTGHYQDKKSRIEALAEDEE